MRRVLRRIGVALLLLAGAIYGLDYAAAAWKIRSGQYPFTDIVVNQVYTSTNRWKQVEWSRGAPVTERCLYALFPHFGNRPCWYVERHTMNVTNTD